MIMNKEQEHDAKLRQASRAGSVAGLFMLLMAGITVLAIINLWPVFKAAPVSSPEVSEQGNE
jgi:hypothetical protein